MNPNDEWWISDFEGWPDPDEEAEWDRREAETRAEAETKAETKAKTFEEKEVANYTRPHLQLAPRTGLPPYRGEVP